MFSENNYGGTVIPYSGAAKLVQNKIDELRNSDKFDIAYIEDRRQEIAETRQRRESRLVYIQNLEKALDRLM